MSAGCSMENESIKHACRQCTGFSYKHWCYAIISLLCSFSFREGAQCRRLHTVWNLCATNFAPHPIFVFDIWVKNNTLLAAIIENYFQEPGGGVYFHAKDD